MHWSFVAVLFVTVASCGAPAPLTDNWIKGTGGNGGVSAGGATGESGGSTAVGGSGGCMQNGVAYAIGDVMYSDSCGSCYCWTGGLNSCIPTTCDYGGIGWHVGDVVPALDDFNICTCQDATDCTQKGTMSCTQLDCTGACSYAGRTYAGGTDFPATDGCNQCSCSNGIVSCTEIGCTCNPFSNQEHWRDYRYLSTTASQCAIVQLACPEGTAIFANACGCGCEQSPDCPQVAQCVSQSLSAAALGGSALMIPAWVNCELPSVCPLSLLLTLL